MKPQLMEQREHKLLGRIYPALLLLKQKWRGPLSYAGLLVPHYTLHTRFVKRFGEKIQYIRSCHTELSYLLSSDITGKTVQVNSAYR